MEKVGRVNTLRHLIGCALVAVFLLFTSACSGQSAEESAWTTIDRPLFEVREVPERGNLYMDVGPVTECRGYWILPGNERAKSAEWTPKEWEFHVHILLPIAEGTYEGLQFKDCFGVKFTTDVDAFSRAAVKSAESQGSALYVCKFEAWTTYMKEWEANLDVPALTVIEDSVAGIENDFESHDVAELQKNTYELALLECQRTFRESD